MIPDLVTDDLIEAAFERRAERAGRAGRADLGRLAANILTLTAGTRQPWAWRLRLTSALSAQGLRPAWAGLLVFAGFVAVALAVTLLGRQLQRAHPGLVAYVQHGDVYVAAADGSNPVRVVHDDGVGFYQAIWSPDGRWAAVQAGDGEYLLNPGTLALRRIATGRGAVWSSDSRSLAFITSSASDEYIIEIARIDTGATRELRLKPWTGYSVDDPLAWSPDGRWFVASVSPSACHGDRGCSPGRDRLVRIDATSGDAVLIAPRSYLATGGAQWSPDSQRFVFARSDPECPIDSRCLTSIVVENADLSAAVSITDPTINSSGPLWSPEGTWVAFIQDDRAPNERGSNRVTLSIERPDGRDQRNLLEPDDQLGPISAFSWSADGTAIDVSRRDLNSGEMAGVFEVKILDGALKTIPLPQGLDSFDWQAIPPWRPIPPLPEAPSASSSPSASIAPWPSPPAAPPADASGSWAGIAVDANCDAAMILDLHTLKPGTVMPQCSAGNYLAFAPQGTAYALAEADTSITVVRSDGSRAAALGPGAGLPPGSFADVQFAWSPDGRWLAARRCAPDSSGYCSDPGYFVVSPDGGTQGHLPAMPSWSSDGRRLVVKDLDGTLLVGSPDGSALRPLGDLPLPSTWSPDGTQFAFIRDGDVWIVNVDGTHARNLTHFAHGGAGLATWSPDGRFMAVGQESRLWIVTLGNGDLRPIDLGNGRDGFSNVVWSPDSSRFTVAAGGGTPTTLIFRTSDWTATSLGNTGYGSLGWSPDGRFISLLDTSNTPGAIEIANGDGSGLHTIWTASDSASKVTWLPSPFR
jgi:Tol biopolymer transport system component